ncbi:hypothetical protein SAMN04488034_101799 [Salinimicrobium catena]|uniref:DUF4136 domain-containing protein n=1 Tax=Salinimicrobium catena TaxID=390640 RepID=A0A1H5JNI0_9FLAO|nr:hypothetical protein [Salinimicrobium catena]SDL83662.1 hypothetical protein SAMN04488140_1169 [Salinimicrobium catena]SEE54079.1 hypothetical protein SAMN04488034_101799 [Salinimicrobium catena]
MKKLLHLVLILTLFTFSSTVNSQTSIDPISKVDFRTGSLEEVKNYLLAKDIIEDKEDKYSFYEYHFPITSDQLTLSIGFNPDQFDTKTLRQLRIYLREDTIYRPEPTYYKGLGPISKVKVDQILKTYQKWYGQHDTIIYPQENYEFPKEAQELLDSLHERRVSKLTEEEKDSIRQNQPKTFVWYEKDYDIEFSLPSYENNKYTGFINSYKDASITYSVKDYKQRVRSLKDSIRKIMKPAEIVEISLDDPTWKEEQLETNFSYRIKDIRRTTMASMVGFKDIVAVKFDIIIKDLFNEELAQFENVIFELPSSLGKDASGYSYYNVGGAINYGHQYHQAERYNYAKNFAKAHTIKLVASIKAIVFSNGDVLKI